MKYVILLTNTKTGEQSEITVPCNLILEELSSKIKMECHLPYTDWAHHRFVARGTTYVVAEHLNMEQEILEEAGMETGNYDCSEKIQLNEIFTTQLSVLTYIQDEGNFIKHKIRCTLSKKIDA